MPDIKEINYMAGVAIVKADLEELVRESERLDVIRNYVASSNYIDRDVLIALLGEPKEKGVRI